MGKVITCAGWFPVSTFTFLRVLKFADNKFSIFRVDLILQMTNSIDDQLTYIFVTCVFCYLLLRLVSLLPLISGAIEKVIDDQRSIFLNSKKLLYTYQSGFQKSILQILRFLFE